MSVVNDARSATFDPVDVGDAQMHVVNVLDIPSQMN